MELPYITIVQNEIKSAGNQVYNTYRFCLVIISVFSGPTRNQKNATPGKKKVCPHCNIEQSALSRHIKTVHSNHRPYSCNECGKAFVRKEHFMKHYHHHVERLTKWYCPILLIFIPFKTSHWWIIKKVEWKKKEFKLVNIFGLHISLFR